MGDLAAPSRLRALGQSAYPVHRWTFRAGPGLRLPIVDRHFGRGEPTEHADRADSRVWWQLVVLAIACFLATLCNPYGFQLYSVVVDYATQAGAYDLVEEHLAMDFRAWWNWHCWALPWRPRLPWAVGAEFPVSRRCC